MHNYTYSGKFTVGSSITLMCEDISLMNFTHETFQMYGMLSLYYVLHV